MDAGNAKGGERGGQVQASAFGKEVSETAALAFQAGGFAGERGNAVSMLAQFSGDSGAEQEESGAAPSRFCALETNRR